MWRNGLLCAHYVGRKGPVWGCFGAVLGPFSLFSRSPSPHVRRFGLGVPGNEIRGVCECRSGNFAEHDLNSAHLAPFCLIYVGLSGIKWLFPGGAFMCFYVGHLIEISQPWCQGLFSVRPTRLRGQWPRPSAPVRHSGGVSAQTYVMRLFYQPVRYTFFLLPVVA